MFGFWEGLIILVIILLFFGAKRLPALGQSVGKAMKNFKRSFKGDDEIAVRRMGEKNSIDAEIVDSDRDKDKDKDKDRT